MAENKINKHLTKTPVTGSGTDSGGAKEPKKVEQKVIITNKTTEGGGTGSGGARGLHSKKK